MKLSVITCCFNSSKRLDRLEAALRALKRDDLEVEFLFVDNASKDDTRGRLEVLAGRIGSPARVLEEPRAGLMFARWCAVNAAQGDWLIFFDDDNEPRPNFLTETVRLIRQYPGMVAYTGNAVLPEEYQVGDGWKDILSWMAVRKESGEAVVALDRPHGPGFPWGAGLVVARASIKDACEVWATTDQKLVGRKGTVPSGGEDVWIAHHITRRGEKVVFSDRLEVVHRIDESRLSPTYASALGYQIGLDYLKTATAINVSKPWLKMREYRGLIGIARVWAEASVHLLRFVVAPTESKLAQVAAKCGTLQAVLLRRLGSGGK